MRSCFGVMAAADPCRNVASLRRSRPLCSPWPWPNRQLLAHRNVLRSEELRAYLSKSRSNKVVLCDFVELEMLKGETLTTIMESTKILADFPKQVVLLKETASAGRLRGKKRGAMKRLSDGRRAREF